MADEQRGPWLIPRFHFEVSWADITINCSEITNLKAYFAPIEGRDGKSPNFFPTKRPCIQGSDEIVLKKAVFKNDTDFRKWQQIVETRQSEDGTQGAYRHDLIISLKDENGQIVQTWVTKDAYIETYEMPDMNAMESGAAMETIKITAG